MKRLDSKVAIITGSAQGMGEVHARLFVAEGAKVVLTDINVGRGQALAKELGEHAMFVEHNVTSAEGWKTVVAAGEAKWGAINVLVNNAGVVGPISKTSEFAKEDYENVCAINQTGVFLGMQAVIPSMLKAGSGSIVNISSIAGLVAIFGSPNLAYVGSKFAVRGMTKFVAVEHGKDKIRVNSVHPGITKTPMLIEALGEDAESAAELVPFGRFAEPSEVSNLVLFLASDDSSYITGSEQVIDGGMTSV